MTNEQVENVMAIAFELARIREEHGAQSGMYLSEVRALRAEVERLAAQSAPTAPDLDTLRADFHEWCATNGYKTGFVEGGECPMGRPVYEDYRTHAAWWAFQKAAKLYAVAQSAPLQQAAEPTNLWRKKPVVIKAVQFTEAVRDAALFDGQPLPDGLRRGATTLHPATRKVWSASFYIETLEGRMTVELNDWIITGVKGEHYPCKPDIFAATYEPADRAAAQVEQAVPFSEWLAEAERLASVCRTHIATLEDHRALCAHLSKRVTGDAGEVRMLTEMDAAFEVEINRISSVHYNSNEICRHFYAELRKRIAAGRVIPADGEVRK